VFNQALEHIMKPAPKLSNLSPFPAIAIAVVLVCTAASMGAQPHRVVDPILTPKGQVGFTVLSGIPFLGFAEVSYGISDGFTVGAFYGISPIETAGGVRIRALLSQAQDGTFRTTLRVPVLFYPDSPGQSQPWWLTWPIVSAEFTLDNGLHVAAEGGYITSISSVRLENVLFGTANKYDRKVDLMGSKEGGYATVGSAVVMPVSSNLALQGMLHVVFDENSFAPDSWVGKVPFVVSVGASFGF
jgi:hypothetical protein